MAGKNKIGITMAYLSEQEQLNTIEVWLHKLYENKQYGLIKKIMFKVTKYVSAKSIKVTERRIDTRVMEDWMEKRFVKDISLIPVRVASEYQVYKRWDRRMMPLLVKTAQRVKKKITARVGRINKRGM